MRFILVFAMVFVALQSAYYALPDQILTDVLIQRGIVSVSAEILDRLFGVAQLEAVGADLVSPAARLSVVRGCDGTAVLIVLASAICAVRCSPGRLFLGLLGATAVVYVMNQIRIVMMFLLLQHDPAWFHLAHIYVAPAAMILVSVTVFISWVASLPIEH